MESSSSKVSSERVEPRLDSKTASVLGDAKRGVPPLVSATFGGVPLGVAALLVTPEVLAALGVAGLLPVVALIGVVHEKKCCAGKYR
jgi:hypothetical protein